MSTDKDYDLKRLKHLKTLARRGEIPDTLIPELEYLMEKYE